MVMLYRISYKYLAAVSILRKVAKILNCNVVTELMATEIRDEYAEPEIIFHPLSLCEVDSMSYNIA